MLRLTYSVLNWGEDLGGGELIDCGVSESEGRLQEFLLSLFASSGHAHAQLRLTVHLGELILESFDLIGILSYECVLRVLVNLRLILNALRSVGVAESG
jgi:hypothetical protein